jgi:hypothetical protein
MYSKLKLTNKWEMIHGGNDVSHNVQQTQINEQVGNDSWWK